MAEFPNRKIVEKAEGGEYNGELWGGVAEDSSWDQIGSTSFIDLNFQELNLDASAKNLISGIHS